MDAFKISVKIFAAADCLAPADFLPVFHRWIQNRLLSDHLMIDVADYAHVHHGPGTVLVTSEANLYTDRAAGRLGLLYSRKLPLEGSFLDRLRQVTATALKCAQLLENEPSLKGRLSFRTNELLIRINDRLLAPNTDQTFAEIKPDLNDLAKSLYGSGAKIEHKSSPLTLFEATIRSDVSPAISAMIESLSAVPA